jgi:hypothetical protein
MKPGDMYTVPDSVYTIPSDIYIMLTDPCELSDIAHKYSLHIIDRHPGFDTENYRISNGMLQIKTQKRCITVINTVTAAQANTVLVLASDQYPIHSLLTSILRMSALYNNYLLIPYPEDIYHKRNVHKVMELILDHIRYLNNMSIANTTILSSIRHRHTASAKAESSDSLSSTFNAIYMCLVFLSMLKDRYPGIDDFLNWKGTTGKQRTLAQRLGYIHTARALFLMMTDDRIKSLLRMPPEEDMQTLQDWYADFISSDLLNTDGMKWIFRKRPNGSYRLYGDAETMLKHLCKDTYPEAAAAFLHYLLTDRYTGYIPITTESVSIRPTVGATDYKIKWCWQCVLCGSTHIIDAPKDHDEFEPPTQVPGCTIFRTNPVIIPIKSNRQRLRDKAIKLKLLTIAGDN